MVKHTVFRCFFIIQNDYNELTLYIFVARRICPVFVKNIVYKLNIMRIIVILSVSLL